MSTQPLSPIRKAWYRWKSLKLPWRKRFLVGLDLQGNSFWEFKDALASNRMRRIVQYPRATHYSEVKISPQWHQWLRHTRLQPPSLTEQSQDMVRQEQLKVLAARADARWAAKPSYLDAPSKRQLVPAPEVKYPEGYAGALDGGTTSPDSLGAKNSIRDNLFESRDGDEKEENEKKEEHDTQIDLNTQSQDEKKSSRREQRDRKDPWNKARGGPSEQWQPQTWSGGTTGRGR